MQLSLLPRELTPETVLVALQGRRGAANGITSRDLVYVVTGRVSNADERKLREIIVKLRNDGHPICAHPALGYHFASTPSELDATIHYLVSRAMTSLRQASAMKRIAVPDLYGQLGLERPQSDEESHED